MRCDADLDFGGLVVGVPCCDALAEGFEAAVREQFAEVECGRKAERPELGKALHLAKVTGATLVIAKLDRPSRHAAFLLALRDSGVRFVAVDMPEANDLTVGIMAIVAQAEREAISRRTKEALAVAKARGVKLGNPMGPPVCGEQARVAWRLGLPSRPTRGRLLQTSRRCSRISGLWAILRCARSQQN